MAKLEGYKAVAVTKEDYYGNKYFMQFSMMEKHTKWVIKL